MLVVFGLLAVLDHYITNPDPIQCKCPGDVKNCDREFLNSACWVQNEFYLPQDTKPDRNGSYSQPDELKMDKAYFQWIGLLFFVQAIFGYVPRGRLKASSFFLGFSYLIEPMHELSDQCQVRGALD